MPTFTFGYTTVGSLNATTSVGAIQGTAFTLSQTGTLNSLSVFNVASAGNIILAVYDNTGSAGAPGALIAQTASTAAVGTSAWQTISTTTTPTLTAGSTYYLVYFEDNTSETIAYDASDLTFYNTALNNTYPNVPSTFPSASSFTATHSIYATLTSSSPFALSETVYATPHAQYVPDISLNPVAISVKPGTEILCVERQSAPDSFRLKYQYVPDILANPVALGVKPGTEALCIQRDPPPELPKPKPQFVSDVVLNSVAIGVRPGTETLCIERQFQPDFFRLKVQYVPDVAINPVAFLAAVTTLRAPLVICLPRQAQQYVPDVLQNPVVLAAGTARPFIPAAAIFDNPRRPQQYIPDVAVNITISLLAVPFAAPSDAPKSIKQLYIPDILFNPVALAIPPPVACLWQTDGLRALKQYVHDVLTNPVALGAGSARPFVVAVQESARPGRQYVPDAVQIAGSLALAASTLPFAPLFFEGARAGRQCVPDSLVNPIIPLQSGVPFIPNVVWPPKVTSQYVPDVLFNPVALSSGGTAVPFIPSLFDQPKIAKQFGAEVLDNAVLPTGGPFTPSFQHVLRVGRQFVFDLTVNLLPLNAVPLAPFIPYNFDQVRPAKQVAPDILSNSVALAAGTSAPFVQQVLYGRGPGRQYSTDAGTNPVVLGAGIVQAPPFTPVLFEPPKLSRPSRMDVGTNPVLPGAGPSAVPFLPVATDFRAGRLQFVPDQFLSALVFAQPQVPFATFVFEPSKRGKQYAFDVLENAVLPPAAVAAPPVGGACFDIVWPVRRQYIAEQIVNSAVAASVLPGAPFAPAWFEQPRAQRPSRADVGTNPIVPTQTPVPFVPSLGDVPKAAGQVRADVGFNPIVPRLVVTASAPFTPANFDTPRRVRQYINEVPANWQALNSAPAAPFVPAVFETPRQTRQYAYDLFVNTAVSLPVPFAAANFEQAWARRSYIPEVLPTALALRTPVSAAPFIPVLIETSRQRGLYAPETAVNLLPLNAGVVGAAPFVPYQAPAPSVSRQYAPDTFLNPVLLGAVQAPGPFVPYSFDAIKAASKQYVPEVVVNQAGIVGQPQLFVDPNYIAQYPLPIRTVQYPQPTRTVIAGMPRALSNFSPVYPTEQVILAFDFSNDLAIGETISISSPPAWSIALLSGIDPTPSLRLIGVPIIIGPFVAQAVGTLQPDAIYNHIATIVTSQGKKLTTSAHQTCVPVN
jgi:hypothetical protein